MENLNKRKQKALLKSIILNVFSIFILGSIIGFYIIPTYAVIGEKVSAINTLNTDLKQKTDSGLKIDEFFTLVKKYTQIEFSPEDKKNNKEEFKKILEKTDPSVPYLKWVKSELSKENKFKDEIEQNDKIISGIIPTYSEFSIDDSLFEKNRITLTDIVSFVENDLLKKYNLTSYSNIGFTNLSFEKNKNSGINIGTYNIPLELSGTNKDLLNFIVAIQNSGKLDIKDGKLVPPKNLDTQAFSNLLISIDKISFTQSLEDPEIDNKMSVGLVFYVRAKSYSDLIKIKLNLAEDSTKLLNNVKTYSEFCKNFNDFMCKNENSLKAIQVIRSIYDNVKELDTQLHAPQDAVGEQDIGSEFEKLVASTSTLSSLKATFTKNKIIIDGSKNEKKPSSK